MRLACGLAGLFAAAALAACGSPERGFHDGSGGGGDAAVDAGGDDAGGGGDGAATEDRIVPVDVRSVEGGAGDTTIVYAHSDTVLYAVDPNRGNAFSMLGTFAFPAGDTHNHTMTDLAVDATGAVVGVTHDALWRIDTNSAACTLATGLPSSHIFVGLTYLPVGTLDPSREVLMGGATDGTFWRIDPTAGTATRLGQLHDSRGTWALSGDFVSIAGAGTYATIRSATTTTTDSLATVDLATGLVHVVGNTHYMSIYGLGYWRATLYGFTRAGQFITINVGTAASTLISTPTMQFSGAGVTTVAPTTPG